METSKVSKSSGANEYYTLRTTIPMFIRKKLELNGGDILVWDNNDQGEVTVRKSNEFDK